MRLSNNKRAPVRPRYDFGPLTRKNIDKVMEDYPWKSLELSDPARSAGEWAHAVWRKLRQIEQVEAVGTGGKS